MAHGFGSQQDMDRAGPDPAGAPRRCVLLADAATPLPSSLLAGLQRRQVVVVPVHNEPAVMVELALGPAMAVVVIDPPRHRWLEPLMQAIAVYYPHVPCWHYEGTTASGRPGMTRIEPPARPAGIDPAPPSPTLTGPKVRGESLSISPPPPPPPPPEGLPPTQVAPASQGDGKATGAVDSDEPLLTRDELALLLGPAFEVAQPRRRGAK